MMLDQDGDDCLPDFSTERFDVFHKHCTRNPELGVGRDVYLAFHRKADVPRPVCVITLCGNYVEWCETGSEDRRQGIAREVMAGLEKHCGDLSVEAVTESGEAFVNAVCPNP
jgi:hypothetical protein